MNIEANTAEALSFLRRWPAATLQLTAIHIDPNTKEKGLIESRAFDKDVDLDDDGPVERWINDRQGKANIYFAVNTLTTNKHARAGKADIQEVVALHVDIDVPAGEDQEATAEKLLETLKEFPLEPSVIISSGGGVQGFWILQASDRIPVNGDASRAVAAECYTRALEKAFGSDHTHNVDRIMRLPGTINVPDIKKIKKGRGPALARLVRFTDIAYPLSAFTAAPPKDAAQPTASGQQPSVPAATAGGPGGSGYQPTPMPPRSAVINWDEAIRLRTGSGEFTNIEPLRARGVAEAALMNLQYGDDTARLHEQHLTIGHRASVGPFPGFSEILIATATALRKAGLSVNECAAVMSAEFPGNKHVARQKDNAAKRRSVERSLGKAMQDIWAAEERERAARAGIPDWKGGTIDKAGMIPYPNMRNARIAIEAMGVTFAKDLFHNKTVGRYDGGEATLQVLVGELSDDILVRVRSMVIERFDYDPGDKPVYDAVQAMALANCFDPVLDMLDEAQRLWEEDGKKPRLDKAAVTYWGAEDTLLNCAFMCKHIMATVARARFPGCKYDDCLVQEGPQGGGKSTSIEIMAGSENFSAQKILGVKEQTQAELVRGTLCYEIAELAGMLRAEVEDVKNFLSRTHDKVRHAYGRVREDQPRRNTFWGSSNDDQYLQDVTGNRRFLPLKVGVIDLEALRRDRLLLLGEASYRVAQGEKWTIPEELWGEAREAQEERRQEHPWEDILSRIPHKVTVHDGDGRQEIKVIHEYPAMIQQEDGTVQEDPAKVEQRVASNVLLQHVLGISPGQQQPYHSKSLKQFMYRLGWRKPNQQGVMRIGKETCRGYVRIVPRTKPDPQPAAKATPKAQGADQKGIPF